MHTQIIYNYRNHLFLLRYYHANTQGLFTDKAQEFLYKKFNLNYVEIPNIANNRHLLKVHGYKRAGIYIWLTSNGLMYIGRSINLYARVRSYFYHVPKYKGVSLIRRYLNKHGFNSVRLILFLVSKQYSFNELVYTEQAFLDFFKPSLNLDNKATPSRYNAPMDKLTYATFIKKRSHPIGVFDAVSKKLLYAFDSKQKCTCKMGINHTTFNKYLITSKSYLNSFIFKPLLHDYTRVKPAINNDDKFINIVKEKRRMFESYKNRNKKTQQIYMQHIDNPDFNRVFKSQRDCALYLKGDRTTL